MQPSTTFACNDSIKSGPWNFSNWPNNQTHYGNILGSDSVSVQETSHSASVDVFPAFGFSDRMEGICAIDPMNLDISQRMTTPQSDGGRKTLKRDWGAFLPLAIDIIKSAQTSSSEAEGFQSDGNNDNGYLSSIHFTPQQNALTSSSTRGVTTSTSTSSSSRARKRPRSDKRTHGSAPSRNRQATSDQLEEIRVKLSLCRVRNRDRLKDLDCPVPDCQYEQFNGRMPDFRRHLRTHMRGDGEIRCKGVPWENFEQHRHLCPKIPSDQQPYAVPDEDGLWIGGCLKTFSRADALKRHLRNTSCTGLGHNRHRTLPT